MKVRCIKTKIEDYLTLHNTEDQSEYLEVGDEFIVYGLSLSKNGMFTLIIWGGASVDQLILAPIEFFEIIDNTVPQCWEVGFGKYGGVTLGPDIFFQKDFLENHSEYEPKEREQFKEFREEFDKLYT